MSMLDRYGSVEVIVPIGQTLGVSAVGDNVTFVRQEAFGSQIDSYSGQTNLKNKFQFFGPYTFESEFRIESNGNTVNYNVAVNASVLHNGQNQVLSASAIDPTVNGINVLPNMDVYSGGVLVTQKSNVPEIALAAYRAIPNSTARKIAWLGDSTSEALFLAAGGPGGYSTVLGSNLVSDYTYQVLSAPGQPFYNVTHGNFGASGHFISELIAGTSPAGKNLSDVAAFKPDLIVFSYGINDVVYGGYTKAQLKAALITVVGLLQAQNTGVPIIIRMPHSFVYNAGFAQFGASYATCQAMSDIMYDAYNEMIGQYSNTYVLDVRKGSKAIFTKACTLIANLGLLMGNELHPSGFGYAAIVRAIGSVISSFQNFDYLTYTVNTIPILPPFPTAQAQQATSISATFDYQLEPRVVEDISKYNLILDCLNGSASPATVHWLYSNDAGGTHLLQGVLAATDICVQYGVNTTAQGSQGNNVVNGITAYAFTGMSFSDAGGWITVTGLPAGYPYSQNNFQNTRVYRKRKATQKNPQDLNFNAVLAATDFTAQTLTYTVQRFSLCRYLTGISATAPTTGGTATVNKNGVAFATLTWANGVATATVSGAFVTAATRGQVFEEGDVITVVIAAGFVGGTIPRIQLSFN